MVRTDPSPARLRNDAREATFEKIATLLDQVTARLAAPIVTVVPIDYLVVQVLHLLDELKLPSPLLLTNRQVILEPLYWIIFWSRIKPTITSDAFQDTFDLPGRFTLAFMDALKQHFPEASGVALRDLQATMIMIAKLYLAAQRGLQPSDIEATTVRFLHDIKELVERARSQLLGLDVDIIRATHGDVSARMYHETLTSLKPALHPQHASAALKQAAYHSTISKRGRPMEDTDRPRAPRDRPQGGVDGMATCRKCKKQVKPGTFGQHNKVCKP